MQVWASAAAFFFFCYLAEPCEAATSLFVTCNPSPIPPAGTICFDEHLGKPFTFYVVALNFPFVTDTAFTGTVHITSSDPIATLPSDYTFKTGDMGIAAFEMTFHSVTSAGIPSVEIVTATDSQDGLQGTRNFNVFPAVRELAIVPALNFIALTVLSVGIGLMTYSARTSIGRD